MICPGQKIDWLVWVFIDLLRLPSNGKIIDIVIAMRLENMTNKNV